MFITDCEPTLNFSGVTIPTLYTKWGYPLASYDAAAILSQYTQTPACNLPITFEAFCHDEQLGTLTAIDEVAEVQFYPFGQVFTFSKCGPDSDPLDRECANAPYTKTVPIVIVASVGTTVIDLDDTLKFNIIFEPDCTLDTIYFNIPADFGAFPYYLNFPVGTDMPLMPLYTQSIPECNVQCALLENLEQWVLGANPLSIVSSFDSVSGAIVVNSNNLYLDGSDAILTVECVSTESQVVSTIGLPDRRDGCDFEINLFDVCRTVSIQAPELTEADVYTSMFVEEFRSFIPAQNMDNI